MRAASSHHLVNRADLSHLISCPESTELSGYNQYISALNIERNYILISGNYGDSYSNDSLCTNLGISLAKLNVGIVSGAGKAGMMVSYGLYECLIKENRYDPDTMIFYLRRKKRTIETLLPPIGTTRFYGATAAEMRAKMISKVKAVISIGGELGTKEEAELATRNSIPVIPIGRSGGSAHDIWEKYKNDNYRQPQNSNPFNSNSFDALDNQDVCLAVEATVALLKIIPGLM